jgi:GT2 family glycosyltransferase
LISVTTQLAVVIVSWNVCDLLSGCLRSVLADLAGSQLSAQIWVVDNASSDGSPEIVRRDFPTVQLIASSKNLGFAGGNNAALRAMGFDPDPSPSPSPISFPLGEGGRGGVRGGVPEAVLLLNPDTEVHAGALAYLYNFLKGQPRAGIAGARLVYGDGRFQHSAFAFPGLSQLAVELLPLPGRLVESRFNGRYARSLYQAGQPFEIGHPLGAVMCVRREAIQQAGLMDEGYHMYVEEIDWSRRIRLAGWQAYCVPTAVVTHFEGQSTGQVKTSSFINLWRSRYRFYQKYYSRLKLGLAGRLVQIGMRRRAAADIKAAAQGRLNEAERLERLASYRQVINIWQGKEI